MAKRGPSDLIHRVQAYTDKVNGANVTTVLTARRDRMLAQENARIVQMYALERNFKAYFEGAALDFQLYAAYLAFAKKCWRIVQKHVGATQNAELTLQADLFQARGLGRPALVAEVLALFGIVIV